MNGKQRNRPSAATPERSAESATPINKDTVSGCNCIMPEEKRQGGVIEKVLSRGMRNGLTARELAALLGFRDTRRITKQIERERMRVAPICASPGYGYYLAENPEELEQYIKDLNHRIYSITITSMYCEQTLNQWTAEDH